MSFSPAPEGMIDSNSGLCPGSSRFSVVIRWTEASYIETSRISCVPRRLRIETQEVNTEILVTENVQEIRNVYLVLDLQWLCLIIKAKVIINCQGMHDI